jgi:hypothetical protein
MNLSELPELIRLKSLYIQGCIEDRQELLNQKEELDIEIEEQIQAAGKSLANEKARDVARFRMKGEDYKKIEGAIAVIDSEIAKAKIELQYLRDMFAVEKIENQGAAYV